VVGWISYVFEEMSADVRGALHLNLIRAKPRPENEQEIDRLAGRDTLEISRAY
jgi:hypothetical protein